jgi:hypothetical protein
MFAAVILFFLIIQLSQRLRISHYDHARHDLHRDHGLGQLETVAWPLGVKHWVALDIDVGISVSLHC